LGEVDVFAQPSSVLQHHPVQITCKIPVKRGIRVKIEWQNFPLGMVDDGKVMLYSTVCKAVCV